MVITGSCFAASAINLPPYCFLIPIYLSSCFLTRNLEPDQRALQGNFRQFDILFLTVTLGQLFLGPFLGALSARSINLGGKFGSRSQHGPPVIPFFRISSAHRQHALGGVLLVAQLPRHKRREKRNMIGQ